MNTPRTDFNEFEVRSNRGVLLKVVLSKFARELERADDLVAANQRIAVFESALKNIADGEQFSGPYSQDKAHQCYIACRLKARAALKLPNSTHMDLTTINQLFLELSQVTTATTAKELALQKRVTELEKQVKELEQTLNDLLVQPPEKPQQQ